MPMYGIKLYYMLPNLRTSMFCSFGLVDNAINERRITWLIIIEMKDFFVLSRNSCYSVVVPNILWYRLGYIMEVEFRVLCCL